LSNEIVVIDRLMYQNQPFTKRFTWDEAKEYAKDLRLGGYDDWRLPTIIELNKVRNPKLDKFEGSEIWCDWMSRHEKILYTNPAGRVCCTRKEFVKNMPEYSFFWSSTKFENNNNHEFLSNAMYLEYFNDITPIYATKENQDFVLCVRG